MVANEAYTDQINLFKESKISTISPKNNVMAML